jgi:hypothetical protein
MAIAMTQHPSRDRLPMCGRRMILEQYFTLTGTQGFLFQPSLYQQFLQVVMVVAPSHSLPQWQSTAKALK